GMTRTGYVLPRWDPRDVAVEYDAAGRAQGRPYDHPWASDGPYWNLRGNGGLLSTARDLFRWHRALAGTAVLTESAKRELFRPRVPTQDGESYAYGWDVKDGFAWHDGGNGWSLALLGRWARDGTVVFWVSNHASTALEDSALDLTRGMADRVRTMGEQ
ncbi:MAG: serine hydrolase, partial [Nonomuraea sp.]|nr:serine hydrolase [Nonomuraea sp.]